MFLEFFGLAMVLASGASGETVTGCIPEASFTRTQREGENFTAAVFEPCEGDDIETLTANLIEDWGTPIDEQRDYVVRGVETTNIGLELTDQNYRAALIHRTVPEDGDRSWVCMIKSPYPVSADVISVLEWCNSFVVGPTRTVKVQPPEQ